MGTDLQSLLDAYADALAAFRDVAAGLRGGEQQLSGRRLLVELGTAP